ncbi:MAG: glycosyltransferase [Lachnospiraceae bacterium]|nr:glycosyltransferase [Lachnospiraceae bacterium]
MKKKKTNKYTELTKNKVKIKGLYNFSKNGKRVKVSVIVPVYNVQNYLRECLDSVLSQTFHDIEIICVNDGSKDSSLDILLEYAKSDTRIKVIDKENAGYGHTINLGVDYSNGDYIGIVESDDCIHPQMYEVLYNLARENNLDFIKSDFYRYTYENGNKQYNRIFLSKNIEYYNCVFSPNEKPECYDFPMHTWTGLYKASFLRKHMIRHNETPGASFQDTGFFFQTFAYGQRVMFVDQAFYYYRCDNPDSSVKSKDKVFCIKDEYDYVMSFLNNHPDIYSKIIKYVWSVRGGSYLRTLGRIDRKFRKEFLSHFNSEFSNAEKKGELDYSIMPRDRANSIRTIVRLPEKYLYSMNHNNVDKHVIRRFIWCTKDNGFLYAIKYAFGFLSPKPWSYRAAIKAHLIIQIHKFLSALHIQNAEMRKIGQFRNIHNGDRCFIVCTGPSLNLSDLEILRDEYTFGVNSIYRAYSHTDWRPTYYTIIDQYIADRYKETDQLDFSSYAKEAVFLNSYIKTQNNKSNIYKLYVDFINHTKNNLKNSTIYVSDDLSIRAIDCFTVTNIAISLAIYMGFKNIYLIGADNNFEGSKIHFLPNIFDPTMQKKGRMEMNTIRANYGYYAMKEYARIKDVNIYNATRGGHLEVFDRVDFDSLFENGSRLSSYDYFTDTVLEDAAGREILLWGNSKEYRTYLKQKKGIDIRNAFKTAKLCDGINTLCLDDIKNKNELFFLINVDSIENFDKQKILKQIGFSSSRDHRFFMHPEVLASAGAYSDEYNNIVNNIPKNIFIHFKGYNSKIKIGQNVNSKKEFHIYVESNCDIKIGDDVMISGFMNAESHSSVSIGNKSRIDSCNIKTLNNSFMLIGNRFVSGERLDVIVSRNGYLNIGNDVHVEKNVSINCGMDCEIIDVESGDKSNISNSPCVSIHSHCFIGKNTMIFSDANIGVGSIVSDGENVKGNYLNNILIGGQSGLVLKNNVCWKNSMNEDVSSINIEYRLKTINDIKVV